MKKYFVVLAGLLVVGMLMTGCSSRKNESTESETSLPNPMVEVGTPEDISDQLGIDMVIPEGTTETKFFIISGNLGDARFTLDGLSYVHRIQKTNEPEDISGMYFDWETTKEMNIDGRSFTISYNEGAEGISYWYDTETGVSHSVSMNEGAGESVLLDITELLVTAA